MNKKIWLIVALLIVKCKWSCVQVTVENLEKGFLINVYSAKSCPGLLVPILEVLEEKGLDVIEARVSCSDTFQFQAVGGEVIRCSLPTIQFIIDDICVFMHALWTKLIRLCDELFSL